MSAILPDISAWTVARGEAGKEVAQTSLLDLAVTLQETSEIDRNSYLPNSMSTWLSSTLMLLIRAAFRYVTG